MTFYLEKDIKRARKQQMRLPNKPYRPKQRFLVSVWLNEEQDWMEDMRFKYIEDAEVHAARWTRLYGVSMTQISLVDM